MLAYGRVPKKTTPAKPPESVRLFRARRRHDRIDAVLRRAGARWELVYSRNDREMFARTFVHASSAREEAASRLKELQRAGWVDHW
jgi:hypothetical protein